MPLLMLYSPNVPSLPHAHVPYPYHHCCNNPRPRFPKESPSPPRRRSHSSSSKRRVYLQKQRKSQLKGIVIDSLIGLGQFYCPVPMKMPIPPPSPSPPPPPPASRESRPTPEPSVTQSQERTGSAEKTAKGGGKKRQRIKKCGRRFGNWIASICFKIGRKQAGGAHRPTTQPSVSEKQEDALSISKRQAQAEVQERRASVASEVTLVETLDEHERVNPPATPPHFSCLHMVYTGH